MTKKLSIDKDLMELIEKHRSMCDWHEGEIKKFSSVMVCRV